MESSRRDLLNDMTDHRLILKNDQNTYQPCFGFTPKTGVVFPKTGVRFYCVGQVLSYSPDSSFHCRSGVVTKVEIRKGGNFYLSIK